MLLHDAMPNSRAECAHQGVAYFANRPYQLLLFASWDQLVRLLDGGGYLIQDGRGTVDGRREVWQCLSTLSVAYAVGHCECRSPTCTAWRFSLSMLAVDRRPFLRNREARTWLPASLGVHLRCVVALAIMLLVTAVVASLPALV